MKRGIVAIVAILLILVAGLFIYGFSQMGDCYPEPKVWRECMASKGRTGNIILAIVATTCLATLWLIFRRRKVR